MSTRNLIATTVNIRVFALPVPSRVLCAMFPQCLDSLNTLAQHVRSSRVFFLFLTNNVFSSPWCMMELVEADAAGNFLVPILVEGAAWGEHGVRKVGKHASRRRWLLHAAKTSPPHILKPNIK